MEIILFYSIAERAIMEQFRHLGICHVFRKDKMRHPSKVTYTRNAIYVLRNGVEICYCHLKVWHF